MKQVKDFAKEEKKRYPGWVKGWIGKDGTKKAHPYLEVNFKFDTKTKQTNK